MMGLCYSEESWLSNGGNMNAYASWNHAGLAALVV